MMRRIKIEEEGGFSFVEIMVAVMLMIIVMFPVIGLVDGALMGTGVATSVENSITCSKMAVETIRAMPFYHAKTNAADPPVDPADFFWGTVAERNPITTNYAPDDIDRAPEITRSDWDYAQMTSRGYGDYRIGVRMIYISSDLGALTVHHTYNPHVPGSDKPRDSGGNEITIAQLQVNVYHSETQDPNDERLLYTTMMYVNSTNAPAIMGIGGLVVAEADRGQSAINSANHNNNSVDVTIAGFGFPEAPDPEPELYLFWPGYGELRFQILSRSATEIEARINLRVPSANAGSTISPGSPFQPWRDAESGAPGRTAPGNWAIVIKAGDITDILYNGLVVEYKLPVPGNITAPMPPEAASNQDGADSLEISVATNDFFFQSNAIEDRKTTMRLIKTDDETAFLDADSMSYNPAGTANGYRNGTVTGVFDISRAASGTYFVELWNCTQGGVGHVFARSAQLFTVTVQPPVIHDVWVVSHTAGAYTDTNPRQRSMYSNAAYWPYYFTIRGNYFETDNVRVFVRHTDGTEYECTVLDSAAGWIYASLGNAPVTANRFGQYDVFVENLSDNEQGTNPDRKLAVRTAPITYAKSWTDSALHNYANRRVTLTGINFENNFFVSYGSNITTVGQTNSANNIVGDENGEVKGAITRGDGTNVKPDTWPVQLNFFAFNPGNYSLVVLDLAGNRSNRWGPNADDVDVSGTYAYSVSLGTPHVLAQTNDGNIVIQRRFYNTNTNSWSAWSGNITETAAAKVRGLHTTSWVSWFVRYYRQGQCRFIVLRGYGFDTSGGSMRVRLEWADSNIWTGDQIIDANTTSITPDRANLRCVISNLEMPRVPNDGATWSYPNPSEWHLKVRNNTNGAETTSNRRIEKQNP